ncbi:MAG: hypothetical protein SV966_09365 [Actinomycetota bacterium]|nr:hypothetical protein [Actinomycetota bacterium]
MAGRPRELHAEVAEPADAEDGRQAADGELVDPVAQLGRPY